MRSRGAKDATSASRGTRQGARFAAMLVAFGPSFGVSLGLPRRASAEVPSRILALDWAAPPECPTGPQMTARVVQLVGHPLGERTLFARGRISVSRSSVRYRLDLVIGKDPEVAEQRTMTGSDCARLAEAAALVLALDIDADARGAEAPSSFDSTQRRHLEDDVPNEEPAETHAVVEAGPTEGKGPSIVASSPPPLARTTEFDRSHPRRSSENGIDLDLGVHTSLDPNSLPRTALGLGAFVTLTHRALSFDVGGTVFEPQFAGGPRSGVAGAYVDLAVGTLRACGGGMAWTLGWRLCPGIEIGVERTRGVGIAEPGAQSALWAAGTLDLDARLFPRARVSPFAGLGVGLPFEAPDVVINNFGTLFEPPVAFFRVRLGLQLRLF